MIALIASRDLIQTVTLLVTVATMIIMLHMVVHKIIPWRYTVLPGLIMAEMAAFYLFVLVFRHDAQPSADMTFVSALIRLQTILAALVFLVAYWISKRKNG